jgi:hypothetical protein
MTRAIAFLLVILTFGSGCQSDNSGKSSTGPRKSIRSSRSNDTKEHGLKYYEGIGWRYIKPGTDMDVLTYTNTQLLEYVRKAMKEERYNDAKFGAGYFIERTPEADDVPEMRRVVATVYEKRGLEEYAFKEYQKLLDAHPGYKKSDEVAMRMYEITTQFLEGKSFRWKLPYQDTLYIPIGSSMGKTSKMYSQVVTNAPYGLYAAQSQYGVGQAHERSLEGFWGIFASTAEYDKATRAYQLLIDRYSRWKLVDDATGMTDLSRGRPIGESERPLQEQIDDMVAQARFRSAELYETQANEGLYDQSMTERSITAYSDFIAEYEKGEDKEKRAAKVEKAKSRINEMRLERARGLKAIALFYEKDRRWEASRQYYAELRQLLGDPSSTDNSLLNDPKHEKEAAALWEFTEKRLSQELFLRRVIDAHTQYKEAQAAERKNKLNTAHKYYLKAKINFRYIADAEMKSTAVTAKLDFNELKDMKDKLDSDLARVQQLIDKKSLEDSGK